jgi:alpha-beta hydrolase superfamily lysophospholipase
MPAVACARLALNELDNVARGEQEERAMATEVRYDAERVGEWGTPAAAEGGSYIVESFTLPDGAKQSVRIWRAANPVAPTLALLHGLGAHSGWFNDMANSLNAAGLHVYVPDHRGFGRSDGERGHTRDWRAFSADVNALLDEIGRREAASKLFALGHSMGGIFVTYAAAEDAKRATPRLAGIIAMNPWIKNVTNLSLGNTFAVLFGGMRGSARHVIYPYDTSTMTKNPEAQRMLEADTYWVKTQSASFLYQIGLRMRGQVMARAKEVRAPALVVQGEGDVVVSQPATKQYFETLGSADKTFKTYPGYTHDCEFETNRSALDQDIAAWIHAHSA